MTKHFLDLSAVSAGDLRTIIDDAAQRKALGAAGPKPLAGKVLAMIFDKPSTRTRVSFDVAMRQLGGETLFLSGSEMQLGRAETIADTARVMSRYVDAIMIRCFEHDTMMTLAANATVPVINALTNRSHPCQLMADLLTMIEYHGPLAGQTVAWLGDGNNVAASWVEAAALFGFQLRMACPHNYAPPVELLAWARANGGDIMLTEDVAEAVDQVQSVVTDVWVSMGQEGGSQQLDLAAYQVNEQVMKRAAGDAIFMHCLPAKRGLEVSAAVIDGPQSVVFDEAENRLHAQKAILAWCVAGDE